MTVEGSPHVLHVETCEVGLDYGPGTGLFESSIIIGDPPETIEQAYHPEKGMAIDAVWQTLRDHTEHVEI